MTGASRTAVALWVALLIVSGIAISRIKLTTDLTALLPRAADRMQTLLVAQLRDGVAARLILIGLEGAAPEALAEASRTIARRLDASALFTYVNNGDPAQFAVERDVLMSHRYLLSSAVTPDRFTAKALRASLVIRGDDDDEEYRDALSQWVDRIAADLSTLECARFPAEEGQR